jgi:hypothetical protein
LSIGNLVKVLNKLGEPFLEELERLNDNLERIFPRGEEDQTEFEPKIKKSANGGYINGGKAKK